MTTRTYRPEDVKLLIGTYQVTGWTEIRIAQNAKSFRHESGLRGKTTRVRNRDKSGAVTISMLQTSPDNDLFTQIVTQDEMSQTGRFSLTLTDLSGQSSIILRYGYIEGYPDMGFSSEGQTREWVYNYQDIVEYAVGGNANSSIDLLSSLLS